MEIEVIASPENYIPEWDYPCVMEGSHGLIVLMTSEGEGVVIKSNPHHTLGSYAKNWAMGGFTPYIGSITITQG